MPCPETSALLDLAAGRATDLAALDAHLEGCAGCRALLDDARERAQIAAAAPTLRNSGSDPRRDFAASLGTPDEENTDKGGPLRKGSLIGRYAILQRLGAGGMGEVYAAHDPELGRKVALKLLLPSASAGGQGRLLREAQAMARLSHPNVVPVFDVGSHGARVFVAMELVDGGTLGEWLLEKPRGWREIVALMIEAGRGLAAAHKVGIVHRDFKPANVLVARSGEVRVTDFGIAHFDSQDGADSPRPGAVVGTPEYMAPEQIEGAAVDARADVFGFCASLYEALYGVRPFALRGGLFGLREAIKSGKPAEPKKPVQIPAFLRAAVLRGLAAKPSDRFASMEELLHAISRDPSRTLRRAAIGVGAALALVALALGFRWQTLSAVRACGGSAGKIAQVWGPSQKQAVQAAFAKTGLAYAGAAWAQVEGSLDAYASGWIAMRTDACLATSVRREQSEELLDLRMACLDDRLRDLSAKVTVLARADAEVLRTSSAPLEDLSGCADARALHDRFRPPKDPAVRAKVAALQERYSQARALARAGKFLEALPLTEQIALEARPLGYRPLDALAGGLLGYLQHAHGDDALAEKTLRAAAADAEAGGADAEATEIWISLAQLLNAIRLRDADAALAMAEAALDRSGDDPGRRSRLELTVAEERRESGKPEEALTHAQAAVAILAKASPPDPMGLGLAQSEVGTALLAVGRTNDAVATDEEVLALDLRVFGPDHPVIADIESQLAGALTVSGHTAEARPHLERALAVAEKTGGPDDPWVAIEAANLARVCGDLRDFDCALPLIDRALKIAERSFGADNERMLRVLHAEAHIDIARGEPLAAQHALERMLALELKTYGPDGEDVALAHNLIGLALLDQHKPAEAKAQLQLALDAWIRRLGANHPSVALALRGLGQAALQQEHYGEARLLYQRALDIQSESDDDRLDALTGLGQAWVGLRKFPEAIASLNEALKLGAGDDESDLADTRFALAKALWPQEKERASARALALSAEDGYRKDGKRSATDLREVDAWLASHR